MRTPPPPRGGGAATPGPPGPRPHGPRRRRRRGRGDREPARPPAPAVVPETSHLTARAAAEAPLTPAEVTEMKEHLAFLRRYREVLRLKLNAAEDLLVNQQREPSERGVCRHLLGKVDRAVIERAIEREPLHGDAAARARMLAGAVRLTADVGVLLAYLEALAHVRSHAEAAEAFAEVVRRIDFESVSATRLARLLQVLIDTFVDHERVQVLFSLLAGDAFRRAFDAALPTFPPAVAEVCTPLRAVHRRLLEDGGADAAPELLAKGLEQVLSAPDPVLRGYAEPLRARMLELAIGPGVSPAVACAAHVGAPGLPYVAVLGPGRPLAREQSVDAPTGLAILAAAARVLHAVALAGVALPDANVERFLCTAPPAVALTLADLDGARRATPAVAGAEHAALVARLAGAVAPGAGGRFAREVGEQAAKEPSLPALIALIERVALRAGPD